MAKPTAAQIKAELVQDPHPAAIAFDTTQNETRRNYDELNRAYKAGDRDDRVSIAKVNEFLGSGTRMKELVEAQATELRSDRARSAAAWLIEVVIRHQHPAAGTIAALVDVFGRDPIAAWILADLKLSRAEDLELSTGDEWTKVTLGDIREARDL